MEIPPIAQQTNPPSILALSRCDAYAFSKWGEPSLRLLEGRGVEGDIHCGETVKHRSRVAKNPNQPNLRQVHLIQSEVFAELLSDGFIVEPGALGENITTRNIDLLALPAGTVLALGASARIEVTGLRNPCGQINAFQRGLLDRVRTRDAKGQIIRRAGIMAIVLTDGQINVDDKIEIVTPPEPHQSLVCV